MWVDREEAIVGVAADRDANLDAMHCIPTSVMHTIALHVLLLKFFSQTPVLWVPVEVEGGNLSAGQHCSRLNTIIFCNVSKLRPPIDSI